MTVRSHARPVALAPVSRPLSLAHRRTADSPTRPRVHVDHTNAHASSSRARLQRRWRILRRSLGRTAPSLAREVGGVPSVAVMRGRSTRIGCSIGCSMVDRSMLDRRTHRWAHESIDRCIDRSGWPSEPIGADHEGTVDRRRLIDRRRSMHRSVRFQGRSIGEGMMDGSGRVDRSSSCVGERERRGGAVGREDRDGTRARSWGWIPARSRSWRFSRWLG